MIAVRPRTDRAARPRLPRPRRPGPLGLAVGGVVLGALVLRLWSIRHGMPWAFNYDEEHHFVPRAVQMLGGSLDPGYFENPPALTYLLFAVFKLRFHAGFPFGSSGFARAFRNDPEAAFVTARAVVALIGTLVAWLVWRAGRRFYDARVGLLAAALVACAFLPVFYSHQALNDVVTLAPLTVGLVGCLLVYERGRPLDYALAGGAIGVATATKYTAGAMLVTLAAAALLRLRDRRDALPALARGTALAAACCLAGFLALNPYALADLSTFKAQLHGQSETAGGLAKLGQDDVPGWLYYLWTLTWGFGWVPLLAAVGGTAAALRSDWRRALLLVSFPAVLFVYMGAQARFFARWLLPAYPALAILAAYGMVRLVDSAPLRRRARPALLLAAAAVALVAQGLVSSVRVDSVLARADTRTLAREWMRRNVPAGAGLVAEPLFPDGFWTRGGRRAPDRYRLFPIEPPFQGYEKKLTPALVDRYRAQGYCWVVTGSYQRDRGMKAGLPGARAYYARLAAESSVAARFSPWYADRDPVEFNFDWSFDYYPRAYARPGPLIEVRRLTDCG
ncbi:MAG: glycosyltransferase family 39 protein [Thermoleophilaceae bacterium]|nr:glycosyltransferase family 39 protein [Thermoleophilaceae bacterium]